MSEILSHPIPAVLVLLGVLILVHELGHFLVGRWCGIAVEVFSIGFGPKIFRVVRKGTDFRVAWIPLGGYVKFAGSHPSEDIPEGLVGKPLRDAPRWQRVLTIAAGPLANFLLAVAVYAVLGMNGVPHPPPTIGGVVEDSPAQAAGIRYGDEIVRIGDEKIETWRDLERIISASPGQKLEVEVRRDGKLLTLELTPERVEATDFMGRRGEIGRAGIALGRVAPIVTVTTEGSPAHRAGLLTGDRILALADSKGRHETPFYPDILIALERAVAAKEASVTLHVKKAPLPTEPSEKAGPERELTLDLSSVQGTSEGGMALAAALGFTDSQLTIAAPVEATPDYTLDGVFRVGDRILTWDGTPVRNVFHFRELQLEGKRDMVDIVVQRGFATVKLPVRLKPVETQRPEGKVTVYTLPVYFWGQLEEPPYLIERYGNPFSALFYGVKRTVMEAGGLVVTVAQLITGDVPLQALGGPMLIASVASESAKRGWETFVSSMAIISINLGVVNLFPIPILDGGQLVLMATEAIRRRPLRESQIENFQKIGFALILALVVLATYNDLSRFWKSMLESLVGAF